MSDERDRDRLLEECREESRTIRRLIEGDPYNEGRPSILGRLRTIEQALWGPPDHPNGIWGMVREGRLLGRTLVAGFFVTVGGAIALKLLSG